MADSVIATETIGSRLASSHGFALGFDFLRIFLAVSVVASHVATVAVNSKAHTLAQFSWFPVYAILSSFFALSGFLIAGSAQRLSLGNFLVNRGLRIVPALAVEVLLSAFVLGTIFTTLELGEYLRSPQTWHYLTNIVGLINFYLPGVFDDHPVHIVNLTLWTVV